MKKYLSELLLRVLNDIDYTSDNEKIAMYNIVTNWTNGVNRIKTLKVYGRNEGMATKTEPGTKEEISVSHNEMNHHTFY